MMSVLLALAASQMLSTYPPPPADTTSSAGSSGQAARSDHTHQGVQLIYKVGSNPNTGNAGPVGLEPGAACTLVQGTDATYSTPKFTFNCTASGGTAHNLLSATHTDTTGAGAEVRGDLVVRNNASQWTRLGIGASGTVLHGGLDPSWSALLTSELSGTITNAQLASSYSGIGACAANQWAWTLNANGAPTCSQPGFSNLSGTATDGQLASAYSGVGSCSAGTHVTALSRNGAPTCATDFDATIQEEGTGLTQRATINFVGPAVTAADDAPGARTKVTVVASGTGACGTDTFVTGLNDGASPNCQGSYVEMREEGTALNRRGIVNFIGPAITATDNAGTGRTDVTVVASGTGACPAGQFQIADVNGGAPTCAQVDGSQLSGIPSCVGAGYALQYSAATNAFSCLATPNTLAVAAARANPGLSKSPCNAVRRTNCK